MTSRRPAAYLDASALVKLALHERETDALRDYLDARDVVSSELAVAEVPRALWRRGVRPAHGLLDRLFDGITLIPASGDVMARAGSYDHPTLRALNAIHVATAQLVAHEIEAFVGYDRRQLEAVSRAGLPVASPA